MYVHCKPHTEVQLLDQLRWYSGQSFGLGLQRKGLNSVLSHRDSLGRSANKPLFEHMTCLENLIKAAINWKQFNDLYSGHKTMVWLTRPMVPLLGCETFYLRLRAAWIAP